MTWATIKRPLVYVGIAVVVLATAFACGRFSSPTKEVVKTEYVDRVQVVTKTVIQRVTDVKWKKVTVTKPDGSSQTTETAETHENENTNTASVGTHETTGNTESTKSSKQPELTIFVLTGVSVPTAQNTGALIKPVIGAAVGKRLIGPVWINVFGLSNGTFGGGVGLQF